MKTKSAGRLCSISNSLRVFTIFLIVFVVVKVWNQVSSLHIKLGTHSPLTSIADSARGLREPSPTINEKARESSISPRSQVEFDDSLHDTPLSPGPSPGPVWDGNESGLISVAAKPGKYSGKELQGHVPRAASCVIFMHQVKAGGHTVKEILRKTDFGLGARLVKCDMTQWTYQHKCTTNLSNALVQGWLPLASPTLLNSDCVWVTMSREPVARLVSAYFYCRYGEGRKFQGDQLCAYSQQKFSGDDATDIYRFAEFWGNFLFRQLLFEQFKDVSNPMYHHRAGRGKHLCPVQRSNCDTWVQFKAVLGGNDTLETAAGRQLLQEVIENNHKRFAVMGVLEDFSASLQLLDLFLPKSNLAQVYTKPMDHGSGKYKERQTALLDSLRNDTRIRRYISADLEIYADVVRRFEEMKSAYL